MDEKETTGNENDKHKKKTIKSKSIFLFFLSACGEQQHEKQVARRALDLLENVGGPRAIAKRASAYTHEGFSLVQLLKQNKVVVVRSVMALLK